MTRPSTRQCCCESYAITASSFLRICIPKIPVGWMRWDGVLTQLLCTTVVDIMEIPVTCTVPFIDLRFVGGNLK